MNLFIYKYSYNTAVYIFATNVEQAKLKACGYRINNPDFLEIKSVDVLSIQGSFEITQFRSNVKDGQ